MIRAVYHCNVILSGIGWNGLARKCLKLVLERWVFLRDLLDLDRPFGIEMIRPAELLRRTKA